MAQHRSVLAPILLASSFTLGGLPIGSVAASSDGRVVAKGVEESAGKEEYFSRSSTTGDFNGDGYEDAAVGVPYEKNGVNRGGGVNVIYGGPAGLSVTFVPDQFWNQRVDDVEGDLDSDYLGYGVGAGDFNGDGYDDLAMGVPLERVTREDKAGAMNVIYGSATGLSATATPDQYWHQNSPGIDDVAEADDFLGYEVGVGNFNGDAYDDVVVTVRYETLGEVRAAGVVHVIYGSPTGLSTASNPAQLWSQDSPGVQDTVEADESFGRSPTTADFNGDGFDDLALGVTEDIGGAVDAGAVSVIYGSVAGLSATTIPDQFWSQNTAGMDDEAESGDLFGFELSAGDFNGDGYGDLAVGVANEDVRSTTDAGAVSVIYGSAGGLSATEIPDQFWHQDRSGIPDEPEVEDSFGQDHGTGDFNADGFADLAIGVPDEGVGSVSRAGAVHVIYGSLTGLSATTLPTEFWHQDSTDVVDEAESNDGYGRDFTAGAYNDDEFDDLVIGVEYEDVGGKYDAGAVNVIYGSADGLSATTVPNQFWHQDS